MFRTAVLRSAVRAAARPAVRSTTFAAPRVAVRSPAAVVPQVQKWMAVRMYSAGGSLKKEEVEGRIMSLLQGFDKVSFWLVGGWDALCIAQRALYSAEWQPMGRC